MHTAANVGCAQAATHGYTRLHARLLVLVPKLGGGGRLVDVRPQVAVVRRRIPNARHKRLSRVHVQ